MAKSTEIRPAELLMKETVGSGWKIIEKVVNNKDIGEEQYSTCYIVKKGRERAFLKAVDLYEASVKVCNQFEEIEKITSRANKEKRIAKFCTDNSMRNVVRLIEAGEFVTSARIDPRVHFIIYEKAEKDGSDIVKSFGNNVTNIEIHKRLTLLHNVTNALRTMHDRNVVHQDVKPANILQFVKDGKELFKIGDFDSAMQKTNLSLDEELDEQDDDYMGSYRFAPIELLYGYVATDWDVVRKGSDFYLLGSLIFYYFTGRSLTELYKSKLHRTMLWERDGNKGKERYLALMDNIEEAFELCIDELAESTSTHKGLQEELCLIVRKLANPIPEKRGEEMWYEKDGYKLTLIPTLSRFGNLMLKLKGK